jgi:Skp family chaperone for outer membrane proteins
VKINPPGTGTRSASVFWHALHILVDKKMLEQITADFGPPLYRRTETFPPEWEEMKKQDRSPAYKFALDPQRTAWLANALLAVNNACDEQKITQEDFLKPEAEWEPIPIDRTDPKLQKVTEAIDKAIQAVEEDNGYNATMPEEKAFVVDSLKAATEKLKKDNAISYAYLKRKAIDTLDILIRRFGKGSVGLVAQAARAAIFDWLKDIGSQLLHWII